MADTAELDTALQSSYAQPVLLLKHSARCVLSARAARIVESYAATHGSDADIWVLTVQHAPRLSRAVTSRLAIEHESPQLIVLQDGRELTTATHGAITLEWIEKAIAEWFSRRGEQR